MVLNFFPCSCSSGNHISTERMRIRKIRVENHVVKKKFAKSLFGVPRATFDPKRKRFTLWLLEISTKNTF